MQNLIEYFPDLTANQISKFKQLELLYKDWNEKINVISRKDIDNFYTNHLLHSLAIAKIIEFSPKSTVLDVGTGGGFPGIPLAILFPNSHFTLIDAIGKKINVVQEVVNALEIKNVTAKKARAQEIRTKFNFVISRAVTSMPKFIHLIKSNVLTGENMGLYYLKGGSLEEELMDFPETKLFSISDYFKEPFFETKKIVFLSSRHIIKH